MTLRDDFRCHDWTSPGRKSVTVTNTECTDCSTTYTFDLNFARARAEPAQLWPPNHKLVPVTITGVTGPVTVTGVTQDETLNSLGDGNTCPDAVIVDGQAQLRAERSGDGNGRVYRISFTSESCDGSVLVCVPHDQSQDDRRDLVPQQSSPDARLRPLRLRDGVACIDDGQIYNSLGPCAPHGQSAPNGPSEVTFLSSPPNGNTATVEYSLAEADDVTMALYDIAGRRVATLFIGRQEAGVHELRWNAAGLETGMYFYRLQAGPRVISKTFLKLR